MSGAILHLSLNQLKSLADLLIGAAYADGDYDGHEAEAIGDILRSLVPEHELSVEITNHLAMFDIHTFSIAEACKRMALTAGAERRAVLKLISEVTHADDILDLAESEYIKDVAATMGASPEEYEDLTFEIIAIEIITVPPPVPPTE